MDFPFQNAPEIGQWQEIAAGVYWIRIGLPFALDHINCWAIQDGDGFAIIDTGVDNEASREIWTHWLGQHPITRIIGTHFHPDHVGLVQWMHDVYAAKLLMSAQELDYGWFLLNDEPDPYMERQVSHYTKAGYDDELLAVLKSRGNPYAKQVGGLPEPAQVLKAGDTLVFGESDGWEVIIGRGHTPEMVCLYSRSRNMLISADQILPKISPVIGVWSAFPDDDPLTDFMDSNRQFLDLPADCLVLPSHGLPFYGLHERVEQLASHHQKRLNLIVERLTRPMTALEIARVLFNRPLDNQQIGFAMAESLAHLNHLLAKGRLTRAEENGVWLYALA